MNSPAPLRVLVVDDEPPARARLVTLLGDLRERLLNDVVGEAGHAQEALQRVQALRPDLVIVDIQMPGMTGIEFARHVRRFTPPDEPVPEIVFCTAFDEYALQAFEVHAIDYLLKPVKPARLLQALERANERRKTRPIIASHDANATPSGKTPSSARRHLAVGERGRVVLVPIEDVVYLKAEMKYTTVRTREREFLIEESLTALEEEFSDRFVRVHRNALAARDHIAGYSRGSRAAEDEPASESDPGWQLMLRDVPETLPVSRRQWPVVKALLRE